MLRRRLLARIGLLTGAFVLGAVGAVWALQIVLRNVDHANAEAAFLIDGIQAVSAAANRVEAGAFSSQDPGARATLAGELSAAITKLGGHPIMKEGGKAAEELAAVRDALPAFLAARRTQDPEPPTLQASVRMQASVQELGRVCRQHVADEQREVGRMFRAMVLGLTLAALVMVNVAILVLVRTAQLILRPVAALVEGSRELAAERFDHRVSVELSDEFAELAHAYNHLAAQLQANESHKVEALRQLAVTLNHGLNNAMSIIELQLGLLDRRSGGDPSMSKHLLEIRAGLARMSQIVSSLKDIRRVVLTDYGPGQKMIDLDRSVAAEAEAKPSTPTPAGHP